MSWIRGELGSTILSNCDPQHSCSKDFHLSSMHIEKYDVVRGERDGASDDITKLS